MELGSLSKRIILRTGFPSPPSSVFQLFKEKEVKRKKSFHLPVKCSHAKWLCKGWTWKAEVPGFSVRGVSGISKSGPPPYRPTVLWSRDVHLQDAGGGIAPHPRSLQGREVRKEEGGRKRTVASAIAPVCCRGHVILLIPLPFPPRHLSQQGAVSVETADS